jgi:starch synthase
VHELRREFGSVSRMDHLLSRLLTSSTKEGLTSCQRLPNAHRAGDQLIAIGKAEPQFEPTLLLAQRLPNSVAVRISFDDRVARKIFASSDFTFDALPV